MVSPSPFSFESSLRSPYPFLPRLVSLYLLLERLPTRIFLLFLQTMPDPPLDLHRLARLWGVARSYQDGFGRRHQPPPESLVAVLAALGAPVLGLEDVPSALRYRQLQLASRTLPPAAVAWDGRCPPLPLTVPASAAAAPVDLVLHLEGGEDLPFRLGAGEVPAVGRRTLEGRELVRRRLQLAAPVPPGTHRLEVRVAAGGGAETAGETRLTSAPLRCAEAGEEVRDWSIFLPLHALVPRPDDGLADLSDLARLARWAGQLGTRGHGNGERGASTVGVLPLLAAFVDRGVRPFDPSPYAPASRLFWNEIWADLAAVPELPECPGARRVLGSEEILERRRSLAGAPRVDYGAERAWRRPVWQALADHFFERTPESRRREMEAFRARRPEAGLYAAFRAVGDVLRTPWQEWPEELRLWPLTAGTDGGEGSGGELLAAAGEAGLDRGELESSRRLHLYAQMVTAEQLRRLAESADAAGLYLDLPLGVHPGSFDVWRHRALFARGASVGAPPDAFFVHGQDWGFPPPSPETLRARGPQHFAAVLRHSMAACRVLRLDHAMQLERLFWIPQGGGPAEGTYVRYPREELLAALVLESRRAGTAVVGEDLGTVPGGVRRAMERHGLARMHVLQFELTGDADDAVTPVPEGALAALDTHDTPTFAAFWHDRDLELRRELDLLGEEEARELARERETLRRALVSFLRRWELLAPGEDDPARVAAAVLEHLAAGPAGRLSVNLEDLWGEAEPQNVPGTGAERPNWRRRAAEDLPEIFHDPAVGEALERIAAKRREARQRLDQQGLEAEGSGEGAP